jgi:hypothetical protein
MSSLTTYTSKAVFEACGYTPHLQPTSEPDRCGICLKDLACDALGADHNPSSKAENTFIPLTLHFSS